MKTALSMAFWAVVACAIGALICIELTSRLTDNRSKRYVRNGSRKCQRLNLTRNTPWSLGGFL